MADWKWCRVTPEVRRGRGGLGCGPAPSTGACAVNILEADIRLCAEAHASKAAEYEAGGNTRGAAELRRVSNLLYAILRGNWITVLP